MPAIRVPALPVYPLLLLLVCFLGFQAESRAQTRDPHAPDQHQGAEAEVSHEGAGHEDHLGDILPLWSILPFAGILLSIALFPLFRPRFWHHYFPAVSAFWALLFAVPFVLLFGKVAWYEILHIYLVDYIPFIILLWGLYTISGGILIEGSLKGTPILNTMLLILGTVIASWIGTTGASMLLIRPILRANKWRERKVHIIVFFIFLVSNIGGCLTPLGDPPLFLGFLHGVPFFWTMQLLPEMTVVAALLILLFFVLDSFCYRREKNRADLQAGERVPLRVLGIQNLLFMGGVVGAVLMSGILDLGEVTILGVHLAKQSLMRDAAIILMGVLSLLATSGMIREKNEFSWFPIKEVAYLFAGIFVTIIPALAILKAGRDGGMGFIIERVTQPSHYFWITGILSSFLDNAPTYLAFLNTALGNFFSSLPEAQAVESLISQQGIYLKAISAGAVFMGANTYIGNAPNFMVKSIAEESGVPMPSFFGYIFRYSLPILFPLFVVTTMAFFL